MILRSITKHVKDQNWFAVFLDFFIVVVGILIAFQITNWNEARLDSQRERVILERLHHDFQRIVSWGEGIMPWVDSAPENTSWLIEQIQADIKPELGEQFRQSAQASVYLYASFEISPTYQELISTGTLSRISNPELRGALVSYGRNRDAEKITTAGLYAIQNTGVIRQAIQFQTLSNDHIDSDNLVNSFDGSLEKITTAVSFDWEALKEMESYLHVVMQNHLYIQGWKRATLRDAKQVLVLLNEEIGMLDQSTTEEYQ